MNIFKVISILFAITFVSGCASTYHADGPRGPELVTSGQSTESGHYAEVGVSFTTWGGFCGFGIAHPLVIPDRYRGQPVLAESRGME